VTGGRRAPLVRIALGEASPLAEQFRLLGLRLSALGRDRRLRRIGVVSATEGEGRTTVALGLARALSEGGRQRVLLLEADLRHPAIDEALGLPPPAVGLLQYLQGKHTTLTVRRPLAGGFWILSAGSGAQARAEVLGSARMGALLAATQRVFDYVIVDCRPLLPATRAVTLQDQLDGFVFVVRSRLRPRETVQRAAALLKPGLVCGLVLNAQRDLVPSLHRRAGPRRGHGA